MKLFNHQQLALNRAREQSLALFHDCGTGKTLTALNIIKHHKARGRGPALVVCPLSIIETAWIEDCEKFTPDLDIVSLRTKKPEDRKKVLAEDHDIYVANYAVFKMLWSQIVLKQFQVIVVDESSKMKDPTSQIARSLLALAGISSRGRSGKKYLASLPVPYRYVLSGTPAPNDYGEYWSQIKFITGAGGDVFNDNFYAFRNEYFHSIPLGLTGQKMWKFRSNKQQDLIDKMAPVTDVVLKEDALDLPPQTYQTRIVELSPPERKAYDIMENDYVLQFANESVLGVNQLVVIMKLRQLTSGFCYGYLGEHRTGTSKLKELKKVLAELGDHQVIIWGNFRPEIQALKDEFPGSSVLWGGISDKDRTEAINNFKDGKSRLLIANPQSAMHGLTFVNCHYQIYFSLNYSYESHKQTADRIHRIGQEYECTYISLVARDTIDGIIEGRVKNKGKSSNEVLNYLRKSNGQGRSGTITAA